MGEMLKGKFFRSDYTQKEWQSLSDYEIASMEKTVQFLADMSREMETPLGAGWETHMRELIMGLILEGRKEKSELLNSIVTYRDSLFGVRVAFVTHIDDEGKIRMDGVNFNIQNFPIQKLRGLHLTENHRYLLWNLAAVCGDYCSSVVYEPEEKEDIAYLEYWGLVEVFDDSECAITDLGREYIRLCRYVDKTYGTSLSPVKH